LVGAVATAVHFGVVMALVAGGVSRPLVANPIAWTVAFSVSFWGHWRLSFRNQRAPVWRSARRFFVVSIAGLALNQAIYAVLLHLGWRYDIALAATLAAVAVSTYLASRYWAFR
jgi:putative flippase GtrA